VSAIVQLPTEYTGGRLVVEHEGKQETVESGATFAAWYTDCRHWVERVESGHRVVLQYDVIAPSDLDDASDKAKSEDDEDQNTELFLHKARHVRATPAVLDEFAAAIKTTFDGPPAIRAAFLLHHRYLGSDEGLSTATLKGTDRLVYEHLRGVTGLRVTVRAITVRMDYPESDDEKSSLTVHGIGDDSDLPTMLYPGLLTGNTEDDALTLIEKQEGAEHTGNEALDGYKRYLAAALVVETGPAPAQQEAAAAL